MKSQYHSAMAGSAASLMPGNALFAIKAFGAKKLVVVSHEGSSTNVDPFINVPLKKLGASKADFVGAPPTASDLTPYFQAAASKKPDVVSVFGMPCVPALQAFRASGMKAKLIQPAQCADASTLEKVGGLANGTYYQFQSRDPRVDPTNPDIKVFNNAVKKYAPNEKHAMSDFGSAVFEGVMNIADLAKGLPAGRVTAAALQSEVRAAKDQKNWLGLSGKYTCRPGPIRAYPGICSTEAQLAQYNDGKWTPVVVDGKDYVDTAPLLAG
jgi:ABC-type branched-subunit amino acid transport system substrate-binding protein